MVHHQDTKTRSPIFVSWRLCVGASIRSSELAVIHGVPARGLEGDEHARNGLGGHHGEVRLAHLRAEVADGHGADIALLVGLAERNWSLDAHVLIGRCLGLDAEPDATGGADQARFARGGAGDEMQGSARLVAVPHRHAEGPVPGVGDADDRDVCGGKECFALGARHGERRHAIVLRDDHYRRGARWIKSSVVGRRSPVVTVPQLRPTTDDCRPTTSWPPCAAFVWRALMSTDPKVIVIGGGIVGLSTAMALARATPPVRPLVVEKEATLAAHQTGHNSGVIHSGIYYKPGSLKARFTVQGAREMVEFAQAHGIAYDICGKVVVATRPDEVPRLAELHRRGTANGTPGLEMIGPERLREIEPHAAGLQALHVASTGIIDYVAVAQAYADIVRQQGGEVRVGTRVLDIRC